MTDKTLSSIKSIPKYITHDPWGKDPWGKDPYVYAPHPKMRKMDLSDCDLRYLADELAYRNNRWRGIDLQSLREIVEVVANLVIPNDQGGINYEDLFHQAMQCLDEAYADQEAEGDAAALLNQWSSILTGT